MKTLIQYTAANRAFAAALEKLVHPDPPHWRNITHSGIRDPMVTIGYDTAVRDLLKSAANGHYATRSKANMPLRLDYFGITEDQYWAVHALAYE